MDNMRRPQGRPVLTVEIICLRWPGNILVSPREVCGSDKGDRHLVVPSQTVVPVTQTLKSGRKQTKDVPKKEHYMLMRIEKYREGQKEFLGL